MSDYRTTYRKTKSGSYAETRNERGVDSVVVRGSGNRWELAVPDHSRVGAYYKKFKKLTLWDLRAIVVTIERILKELNDGTQDKSTSVRDRTKSRGR